jgi:hypothetical protein
MMTSTFDIEMATDIDAHRGGGEGMGLRSKKLLCKKIGKRGKKLTP